MSHFEIEAEGLRVSRRFLEGCWASCGAMRGGAVPPILRQDLTRHFGYDWGYASWGVNVQEFGCLPGAGIGKSW